VKLHEHVRHPSHFIKEKTGFAKFNRWLAVKLGNTLGSMPFFYLCVVLDIAELPSVIKAHSVLIWIAYISQTVIQLIALPILSVQANIQQENQQAKADADHQTLTYLATIQDEQLKILKYLKEKKK